MINLYDFNGGKKKKRISAQVVDDILFPVNTQKHLWKSNLYFKPFKRKEK